jgi:hypothetical protein
MAGTVGAIDKCEVLIMKREAGKSEAMHETLNADFVATDDLLNTRQAAKFLGLRPQTLSVWRCHARYGLRFFRLGGSVRYRRSDLQQFLERSSVMPGQIPSSRRRTKGKTGSRDAASSV